MRVHIHAEKVGKQSRISFTNHQQTRAKVQENELTSLFTQDPRIQFLEIGSFPILNRLDDGLKSIKLFRSYDDSSENNRRPTNMLRAFGFFFGGGGKELRLEVHVLRKNFRITLQNFYFVYLVVFLFLPCERLMV